MAVKSKDVKTTPAGIHDDFKIVGIDMKEIFKDERFVLESSNKVSVSNLSTELVQGMSITAYDGIDYDKIIDFKSRKERLKNKDKIVNFEDRKAQKENDEQVI